MMGDDEAREVTCCYSSGKAPRIKETGIDDVKDAEPDQKNRLSRFCEVFAKIALIIGGFIIFLGALRNTLTYYLQMFWGVSGDFWMRQWGKVCDVFEEDRLNISLAMFVAIIVQYWLVCAFFLIVDLTRPSFIIKYKMQPTQNDPIPEGKLRKAVLTVIANQTLVTFPIAFGLYHFMGWRGCGVGPADLPSFQWVMLELFVFLIIEEIGFYYSHRLAHHPKLYKYVHKKHHEWVAPISVVAIYAHPIEHIFSNTLPLILGPMIMGSHVATLTMWTMLAQASAINSHCGYHLPLLPSPEAHDFHHLKFTNNYGTLGILDRLHGTDEMFRKTKPYLRHFLLLGLTPVTQTYPDDPKCRDLPCDKDE
ncbi:fatty acid hydroxylase domain-containing protein 2-like [Lytechinus pictus]|uniref:fatty acid hydroxylase domain-containing protein 2-like n=1 Tax=Lytechinus pictus TaxID=7653 RepID=UPI0030B9E548